MMDTPMIVGIAGVTCGGKSTFTRLLRDRLAINNRSTSIIHQDDYFYTKEHVRRVANCIDPSASDFYNYDEPEAIDVRRFVAEIENIRRNTTVDFILVDGNMITELMTVDAKLDRVLFFTLEYDECRRRRVLRIDYDPADEPGYFDQIVWPAYINHREHAIAANTNDRTIFIDGQQSLQTIDSIIEQLVSDLLSQLIRIQRIPISIQIAVDFVTDPSNGAISIFAGTTRDNFNGRRVLQLEYEAYDEMAIREMRRLYRKIKVKYPTVSRCAIIHRIGVVPITEVSVVIAIGSAHRADSLAATSYAIDELKRSVTIWKKEIYADDTSEWKENNNTS